ncbi:hypothetical protein H6G89_14810 [Oscillatoria sp. FACHB-1407]|uniref:hypothetical protein n=1 Tax=Oscillatoria sp. FACHB-1407 TaxID=2692847 RepID=UPI001683F196|nr:hypothetical protein [Oscillatoria sp. FACHB-1407]MBD2462315.1 hypothetical protein [Oscillatoria sp. FACHB-1407]
MSAKSHHSWQQLLGTSIVALVCVLAIGLLQVPQLAELQRQATTPSVATLRQQLEAQKVQLNLLEKIPTFGFDNLIADWAFLNFLQYFGDEPARQQTDYSLSPEFFDVVLTHNPRFLEAYTFLSTSTALYAGEPERSVALMDQGLESLSPTVPPGSFFVWRNKGIDELLFLGDSQAARRSFETAAEWASQSNIPGSDQVAQLSRQTAQFLANNPDSKTAQVAAWAMVLENAPDDRTRRTAVDRIRLLGGDVVASPDGGFQIMPPSSD